MIFRALEPLCQILASLLELFRSWAVTLIVHYSRLISNEPFNEPPRAK